MAKRTKKTSGTKSVDESAPASAQERLGVDLPRPLEVEYVDITSISPDPANARKHGDKNLEAIKSSLRRFGQQKPIVLDANGVVRAGNGQLAAAIELGWKQIHVVRSTLMGSEMTAFAIADNRTAELAEWDRDVLAAELESLREEGTDLAELGFEEKDLSKFLHDIDSQEDSPAVADGGEKFQVLVICKDEADQLALLEKLNADGRDCRAMVA